MKLTALLLTVFLSQIYASGRAQSVSVSGTDIPLREVFAAIKEQTGYMVFARKADMLQAATVSLSVKAMPLRELLDLVLKKQPLEYVIKGRSIILSEKPRMVFNSILAIPVNGRVIGEDGLPLPSVSIVVRKTKKGTSTANDGGFSIEMNEGDELQFTSIGLVPLTLRLDGGKLVALKTVKAGEEGVSELISDVPSSVLVRLAKSTVSLNEIIVNKGYYSVKQRENTGNVTTVRGEEIRRQPISDPVLALQGMVPGLYITQSSGIPGARMGIQLRGQNSIANGNDPLYIVDGVPFSSTTQSDNFWGRTAEFISPFSTIPISEIERIEVLKDADATAIYGSRAANGVILITTRKGTPGKTRVSINLNKGWGKPSTRAKLLNTQQYLEMRREAFANDGLTPGPLDYDVNGEWDTTRYTDWQKVLIGNTAHMTNLQANITGGAKQTTFYIGGAYRKETMIFPGDFADIKTSMHTSIDHRSDNQKFHISLSASYLHNKSKMPTADIYRNIRIAPNAPALYDDAGKLNWAPNENGVSTFNNPLADLLRPAASTSGNMVSNVTLSYELMPHLRLQSNFAYNKMWMKQTIKHTLAAMMPDYGASSDARTLFLANDDRETWNVEPQLSYERSLGDLKLDMLVGTTFQENQQTHEAPMVWDFSSDELMDNPSAGANYGLFGYRYAQYRYSALFARFSVNWRGRYLLNLTGRRDGSSRFGPGKRFGNFGAIGAGWIFTEEDLIKRTLPFLSFGKLRASYGTTGNDQLGDYRYLSTYITNPSQYQGGSGIFPELISNPYFSWETVRKMEAGLELGFFEDRIRFAASLYRNRTGNQLVGYSLPPSTGFLDVTANLPAIVQNSGAEFELSLRRIVSGSFNWDVDINLSIPRNKLVAFPGLNVSTYANYYMVGYPVLTRNTMRYLGVDPATGLYTMEDHNNDGKISNPDDKYLPVGTGMRMHGGMTHHFRYKGWQLEVLLNFVKKNATGYMSAFGSPGEFNSNQPPAVLDRWRKPGDIASVGKFSTTYTTPASRARFNYIYYSNGTLTDASFIGLRNVSLSWDVPGNWLRRLHMQGCSFSLQGQNLLVISTFRGMNPETSPYAIPALRMITAGIQLTL